MYKPVVAFVLLIGVLLVRPQALQGPPAVTTILSGEFWAFVGVVAGIYTIFALGVQLQFGYTGCSTSGRSASWRSARTRWRP